MYVIPREISPLKKLASTSGFGSSPATAYVGIIVYLFALGEDEGRSTRRKKTSVIYIILWTSIHPSIPSELTILCFAFKEEDKEPAIS